MPGRRYGQSVRTLCRDLAGTLRFHAETMRRFRDGKLDRPELTRSERAVAEYARCLRDTAAAWRDELRSNGCEDEFWDVFGGGGLLFAVDEYAAPDGFDHAVDPTEVDDDAADLARAGGDLAAEPSQPRKPAAKTKVPRDRGLDDKALKVFSDAYHDRDVVLTVEQIAEKVGCSKKTASEATSAARKRIKERGKREFKARQQSG